MKKKTILGLLVLLLMCCSQVNAYDKNINSPVYRVYNPTSGEHLYTMAFGEAVSLQDRYGWKIEGVAFYSLVGGQEVYRLYAPDIDDHLYTADLNEINYLQSFVSGWLLDYGPANPVASACCFWSGGSMPIYRLYNPGNGRHLITADINEYNTLPGYGWIQEGIAFHGVPASELV